MTTNLLDALRLAEQTITATLEARGYKPGACTDGWSPEVRAEVAALVPIRAALAEHDAPKPAPTAMLCPHCGSDDLAMDGAARWNGHEWELTDVHDSGGCCACEAELKLYKLTERPA